MKTKTLSYAVTAALALSAGAANANLLSSYNPATTIDVYISGSSAQDGSLELYIDSICQATTLDIYHQSPTTNQRMMYCNIDGTKVPGLGGQAVLFHKSSGGGSGEGVQPVADQQALQAMLPTSNSGTANDNCGAGSTQTPAGGLPAYTLHNCSVTNTALQVPDAGISDEEPALFGATPTEISHLNIQSQDAVIFGIIVTKNVRDVLQKAQGLVVGDDTETNMPSLQRTAISSMFAGNIYDWGQLLGNTAHPLTDGTYGTPPTGDTSVYISRRVSTSGTEVGAQVYFLNQGCANNIGTMLAGNDAGGNDVTGGGSCGTGGGVTGTVDSGSGTGNVKNCMSAINTANLWGIGIIGVENVPGTAGWRFVKINGFAPTLLNVENGNYDYVMQNSIQWRNAASGNALVGNKLTLMTHIATENGSPTILSAVDGTINQAWGGSHTGYLALTPTYTPTTPALGIPLTDSDVLTKPVMTMTKSPLGAPNNCQPPQILNNIAVNPL